MSTDLSTTIAELRRLLANYERMQAGPSLATHGADRERQIQDRWLARARLQQALTDDAPALLDAAERCAAAEQQRDRAVAERDALRARIDELYSLAEGAKP